MIIHDESEQKCYSYWEGEIKCEKQNSQPILKTRYILGYSQNIDQINYYNPKYLDSYKSMRKNKSRNG